ncbi:hypothetical protein Hanom_Chr07g00608531 [Helianthus anomalus]
MIVIHVRLVCIFILKINVLDTIIHVSYLHDTYLFSLDIKPAKTHQIIELGISRGREGPLARKAPFRATRNVAPTSLSSQLTLKPINRRTTSLFLLAQSHIHSPNALNSSTHYQKSWYRFSFIFLHFITFLWILIPLLKLFLQIILIEGISWMDFTSLLGQIDVETSPHVKFES